MADDTYVLSEQLNYNASFPFDKDILPNQVSEKQNDACRKYHQMLSTHINNVCNCWFKDTGIETEHTYGDYMYEDLSHPYVHQTGRSLRTIALEELQLNKKILYDIDDIIQMHDRSRFSEDEFYAAANYLYGSGNLSSYRISQLKHYQRNAHEFTHYVYHTESGSSDSSMYYPGIIVEDIPTVFLYQRVAVWLSNYSDYSYRYNTNVGQNPFQYFWGRDTYYVWQWVPPETEGGTGHWEKVWGGDPMLPQTVYISYSSQETIKRIIDRWAQKLGPAPDGST